MASAAIAAGGSILSGIAGGKGAKKAAKIQAAAYQKGIDEQARQFNITQANIQPDVNAGNASTQQILRLLGLGAAGGTGTADEQQANALGDLKSSPLYTGAYNTGVDTILQNASATGGLRGGNTQNSLAQFGGNLFSQVYQNDLSNLFGLSQLGAGQASSLGSLGQANASATSGLLAQQGGANATAAAAPYAAFQQILSGLGSAAGSAGGSGVWNGQGAFPSSAYGW